MKGTTSTGFSFDIDEDVKDDMELLEALCAVDGGDVQALPTVLVSVLGKEQKKALYDHCRTEKGRVSSQLVMLELKEIFEAVNESESPLKN